MKSHTTGTNNMFAHKRHELYSGRPQGQHKHQDEQGESPAVRKLRHAMAKVQA